MASILKKVNTQVESNKINLTDTVLKLLQSGFVINDDYKGIIKYYLNENFEKIYGRNEFDRTTIDVYPTSDGIRVDSIYGDSMLFKIEDSIDYIESVSSENLNGYTIDKSGNLLIINDNNKNTSTIHIHLDSNQLAKNTVIYKNEDNAEMKDVYTCDMNDDHYRFESYKDGRKYYDCAVKSMGVEINGSLKYAKYDNMTKDNTNANQSFIYKLYSSISSPTASFPCKPSEQSTDNDEFYHDQRFKYLKNEAKDKLEKIKTSEKRLVLQRK